MAWRLIVRMMRDESTHTLSHQQAAGIRSSGCRTILQEGGRGGQNSVVESEHTPDSKLISIIARRQAYVYQVHFTQMHPKTSCVNWSPEDQLRPHSS